MKKSISGIVGLSFAMLACAANAAEPNRAIPKPAEAKAASQVPETNKASQRVAEPEKATKKPVVRAKKKAAPVATKEATDQSKIIADKLLKKFPATQVSSVRKSPMKGLYEVVMGRNIAYVDEDANLFLFGHIFDMAKQEDLTQARVDDLTRVDFAKLPLDKAIKVVKGNGSRIFVVFSDPDCPYCKQLEQSLSGIDNYTMYVLLYPIGQLHPEAATHADAIWCANDKAAAWQTFMKEGKLPEAGVKKDCGSPVADIARIGQSLGVQGTPTLVRPDGKVIPGIPPASTLEMVISGASLNLQAADRY